MSLVGTRPPTVDEWELYEPHHRARMSFRPGLTGMWQVSGRSNITDFEEVVKLDTQYIKNIGNGFANTLVVHTGANFGGLAFNNVIAVGESIDLFFMVDEDELKEGLHFGIQYIDSMRNEYIQEYDMKKEYSSIKIECGYPGFLEQF